MYDMKRVFEELDKVAMTAVQEHEWTIADIISQDEYDRKPITIARVANELVKKGVWKRRWAIQNNRRCIAYSWADKS